MEFNAVYHQASDNYCYPLNEDELIINIKTAAGSTGMEKRSRSYIKSG